MEKGDTTHQTGSCEWLHSLYQRAPLGLFRADENWVLVEANPQLARILGYESHKDILGKSLSEHFVVDVDKLKELPFILEKEGAVDAYRVRARRRDGTIVWLSLYCSLAMESGKRWFDGLAIDFTKRKQLGDELRREKRNYQRLITNLPGIVYTAVLEGDPTLVFVSPQIENFLGVSSSEVLSRGGFFEGLIHPEDQATARAWLDRLLQHGEVSHHTLEIRLIDSNGRERWFRNIVMKEEEDGITLVHGMMFETTELRRAEEELRHVQKMEALGRLVAGIAHDFKNVLTAIMGFADVGMEEAQGNPEVYRFFSVIKEQGEKASSLIKKLLDFARSDTPAVEMMNPVTMLKGVAEVLHRTLPKNIEVHLELEDDLPFVMCDEVEMEQVLLNLAINARDAMPEGGRLTITATSCEVPPTATGPIPPGKYLRIVVEDTGTGMPPEILERATEPFFTTKKRGVGTGLGLSQVMGIVKSHGGYFFLESEVGEGTRAIIYLPAVVEPIEGDVAEEEEEREEEGLLENTAVSSASKGSVLVVDDEKDIRILLSVILEEEGFKVYPAANGEDALDLYRRLEGEIDLVVTDMVMPKMGGKELVKRLKELNPALPIIAISGYASAFSFDSIKHLDRMVFLAKPVSKKDLVNAVREVVGERQDG